MKVEDGLFVLRGNPRQLNEKVICHPGMANDEKDDYKEPYMN